MKEFSYLKIIAIITVFILLLLIFFLLTVKSNKKLSNNLFAGYLLINAIDISGFFLAENITVNYPNLEIFRWTLCLLSMPLLFLYVLTICYTDFRLKWKHLLHFTLFILFNLALVPRIYLANNVAKKYFFKHHFETTEMLFFQSLIELQYLFYIVAIITVLKKFKAIYLENYTNPSTAVYKWLSQMLIVFVIDHYFSTLRNLLRYTEYHSFLVSVNALGGIIALLVTCWFVLNALHHPELFTGINSNLQTVKKLISKNKTSSKKGIPPDENPEINSKIASIKQHMSMAKPYLDPSLTIHDLANQINIPVSELSILINVYLNQHFFDFVNHYRIENAMEILRNHSKKELTILQTLDKVGFNSKSSFNTAFKKHTSVTPTQYRNSSLS